MTKQELVDHILGDHDPGFYLTAATTKAQLESAHHGYHASLDVGHEHEPGYGKPVVSGDVLPFFGGQRP